MSKLNEHDEIETRTAVAGRLNSIVMFIWGGLGKPGAWVLLMILVFINDLINGQTVYGSYWMTVCIFAFFLARIAEALEKKL